jgi:hypothetical protein
MLTATGVWWTTGFHLLGIRFGMKGFDAFFLGIDRYAKNTS